MLRYHMTSLNEDLAELGLGPRQPRGRRPARRTEGAPGMPPRPARPARPPVPPAAPPPAPEQEDDEELAALAQDDQGLDDQDLPPGQDLGMEDEGVDDQGQDDQGLDLGTGVMPPDESLPPEDDEAAPQPGQGGCDCQGAQAPMESRRPRPARRAPVQRESVLSKRVASLLESSRNILRSLNGNTVLEARRGFQLLANSAHYAAHGLTRANKVYRDVRVSEACDALKMIKDRCVQVESALKTGRMTVAEAKPRHDKFFEHFKGLVRVYSALIEDDEEGDKPNEIDPFNKRELPDPDDNGLAVESEEDPFDSEDEEDGEDQMEGEEEDGEGHEEPDGDEAPFPGAAKPFGKEEGVARRPFRRPRGR